MIVDEKMTRLRFQMIKKKKKEKNNCSTQIQFLQYRFANIPNFYFIMDTVRVYMIRTREEIIRVGLRNNIIFQKINRTVKLSIGNIDVEYETIPESSSRLVAFVELRGRIKHIIKQILDKKK